MRTSLTSGEDGLVDPLLDIGLLVLSEKDQTGSGSPQSLVRGGGHDVTEVKGRAVLPGGDETRDVRHVGHEVRSVGIGDLPQPGIVPVSGVSRGTTDYESGLVQPSVDLELLVVDQPGLGVDTVRERLEVDGRRGDLLLGGVVPVGQMSTVGETETHDPILRVDQGGKGGKVGGGSRVGLDVDTPDLGVEVERLQSALSAQVLENVNVLVSSVVSSARETLGVLVGEHRSVGLHDGQRGQVLPKPTEFASAFISTICLERLD